MNNNFQHKDLASGRWQTMTIFEQMGNVGGEISRLARAGKSHPEDAKLAFERALELLDLTLQDPRWKAVPGRLKEISRTREILCRIFLGDDSYKTTLNDLDRYFLNFALASRLEK